jgi:starch-binding outer membrane protein, SusD/RagB family
VKEEAMNTKHLRSLSSILALGMVAAAGLSALPACDLDVPDLNNPPISDLEENPTREIVASASTGLFVGSRGNIAAGNGYVVQLGILGREAYNFDPADPRFIGELLGGPLQPSSPFGGNFWAGPYANLRLATLVLGATDLVDDFSAEERAAIRGFTHTMMAYDLLIVINTHDTNGAVIGVGLPKEELAPFVDKAATFTEINRLLDAALTELAAGGDTFPFQIPGGFDRFDTPATFSQFNRAIRARTAVYTADYAGAMTALDASFINADMPTLDDLRVGANFDFSAGPGDITNGLVNRFIFAHPSIVTEAQMNGAAVDARVIRKIVDVAAGTGGMLESDKKFTLYAADAQVPIIRNEELILLRAEALWGLNMLPEAIAALNTVRTVSGGLPALATTLTADEVENEILYNRRYSLLFEGGHRWIDMRRFGRLDELPLDLPDHVRNARYPIPLTECDARPDNEPACLLGSM